VRKVKESTLDREVGPVFRTGCVPPRTTFRNSRMQLVRMAGFEPAASSIRGKSSAGARFQAEWAPVSRPESALI